jgi:hypothetical protein
MVSPSDAKARRRVSVDKDGRHLLGVLVYAPPLDGQPHRDGSKRSGVHCRVELSPGVYLSVRPERITFLDPDPDESSGQLVI